MKDKSTLSAKLINSLLDEIKHMEIGEKIPTERQLCDIYNISRTTVRNAISYLELNGYVKRIQGRGTFVHRPSDLSQNLSDYYSFTEQTKRMGRVPKTEILEYHIEKANNLTKEKMNLAEDALIMKFIRLRKSDDIPMMLETTFLSYEDFPEITKLRLEQKPLYDIFEEDYNRKIHKVQEIFSVTTLSKTESKLLAVNHFKACLKIERLSYDIDGNLIEYTISLARGDKFNYKTIYYPK
ncbi:MAG: GntR family transcriptional regulator [Tissierellia bacterium]|nr:GntR family transcriptional regulator [Tissierellia bacterium]